MLECALLIKNYFKALWFPIELTKKIWTIKKVKQPRCQDYNKSSLELDTVLFLFLIQTIKILTCFLKDAVVVWQDLFYECVGCILLSPESSRTNRICSEWKQSPVTGNDVTLSIQMLRLFCCPYFYQGSPKSRMTELCYENSTNQLICAYIYAWIWKKNHPNIVFMYLKKHKILLWEAMWVFLLLFLLGVFGFLGFFLVSCFLYLNHLVRGKKNT